MRTIEFKPVKDYEVIDENLGAGSFGVTKLIRDPSIDELFVCKKYEPQHIEHKETFYQNFKKEIKLMYNINHPNVIRVFTYYLYEFCYTGYIIMEYVDGSSIDKWADLYWLSEVTINDVFRQLIEGFACIENNGIIHRDIRESNILISNTGQVKIIDFGLGKDMNYELSFDSFNTLINRTGMKKIPDEFHQKKYTSKTDMFCLAELLDRIIKKYNIKDFEHDYILQKMLNSNPDKRYESFNSILDALDKKEFRKLEISEEDKAIYNDFVSSLYNCISQYSESKKFQNNESMIVSELGEVLENNCLNYNVGNITDVISIFVKCRYKYFTSKKIEVESLKKFYDWLISKDEQTHKIVLKNIISRLSTIVEIEEVEIPF